MTGRLFLIDGHALVFKMYYAFLRRPMINSKGADMSILYGFTKYLLELIEREKPSHIAVAFDPPGGTFRNEIYPLYKANRSETPQLVIDALEPLTELCQKMNIPVLMMPGFEADDVIGSAAKKAAAEGFEVYMVTPDKDYGQLIDATIYQYKPAKGGGENEVIGVQEICQKYGICQPEQVIDMLTLCGDSSDNVPGVNGVGEIGAGKLIAKYGSVDNIYTHLNELSDKQRAKFEEARPHIDLSRRLVTIKTDIEIEVPTSEMKLNMDFNPQLADLFEKYEFNSLKRHISHIAKSIISQSPAAETAADFSSTVLSATELGAAAATSGRCAICLHGDRLTLATLTGGENPATASGSPEAFASLLADDSVAKYAYDIKALFKFLSNQGLQLRGPLMDLEIMHYILNPEKSHKLEILVKSYLGISLENEEETIAQTGSLFDMNGDSEPLKDYDKSKETAAILCTGLKIKAELESASLMGLYREMEEPLISVLARMEMTGVKVDVDSLKTFANKLRDEIETSQAEVRRMADAPELNVGSPKQIGEVLFEKMKLDPKAKKSSKGSWSTDEETLLGLKDKSPIIQSILDFRAAKKLLSTYIEPFPGYISPLTGRIHTTFNQALTSTGRLSSSNPNLQNIPIRTERGKEIRKAFVGDNADKLIMSADYSQIELRIMAHLSCDDHLIKAFRSAQDVHSATASKIFKVPVEEVTSEQRRIAKTANFGIMYGISAFGLAQRLGISRTEASNIISDYFQSFPSISAFIDSTLVYARETGYVETVFGRRRYIPDIVAKNASIRAVAERNAVNAPIQGTSADIIKLAMIKVDKRIREEGMESKMVLQIHDELLFETTRGEEDKLMALVKEEMENVIKLSVPLTVDCNYGQNWLEAH